jgi:hypothetical protein
MCKSIEQKVLFLLFMYINQKFHIIGNIGDTLLASEELCKCLNKLNIYKSQPAFCSIQ